MTLSEIGWRPFFSEAWEREYGDCGEAFIPGRIASSLRGAFVVWTERGEIEAPARAKLVRSWRTKPCTGDWVALKTNPYSVDAVLPRRTKLSRKAPGEKTVEQVLAANIDTVFLVAGLDRDFNLRRLERYLTIGWESGATPVVILNKADLGDDPAAAAQEVEAIASGAAVVLASAETGLGIEEIEGFLNPGDTAALIGSSGVGKSALTNALFGYERRAVGQVRDADGRGRHTTVGRELIQAPSGWLLMDLPGIREIQPWAEGGVEEAFSDIEALIASCRFSDCGHGGEPGCAVREALGSGALDADRYANYLKVQEELERLGKRRAELDSMETKKKLRRVHRDFRKTPKRR